MALLEAGAMDLILHQKAAQGQATQLAKFQELQVHTRLYQEQQVSFR